MNPDSHDLIQRHMAGLLTDDEATVLQAQMKADTDLRRLYLHYMNLDVALEAQAGSRDRVIDLLRTAPMTENKPASRWLPWRPLEAAAALLFLAVGGWMFSQRKAPVMVEIANAEGTASFRRGERVHLHEVSLPHGALRLRLESGVLLDCAAPFEARFESPSRLRLFEGCLSVDVGARGFGFTVVTDGGEIVDLGTVFGVEATKDGRSSVAVFSGKVVLRQPASANVALSEGEGVSFGKKVAPTRLQSVQIALNDNGASMLGSRHAAQPLVGEVRDNLGAHATHRYYGVVAGGMKEKAKAFVDRPAPLWKALPKQAFPAELVGADLIQTFQDMRWFSDFALHLKVTRPAVVYVLHDPRNPPPEWLRRSFTKTDMRLRSGSWTAADVTEGLTPEQNGRFHIVCEVWKREVREPGTIDLGPPYEGEPDIPSTMYGIAVKPLL